MTTDNQIINEKLQNDINTEATKISYWSPGKIGKYEYFTGKEILPSNPTQIIEQVKFTNLPLGKAFENKQKQIKIKEKTSWCFKRSKTRRSSKINWRNIYNRSWKKPNRKWTT